MAEEEDTIDLGKSRLTVSEYLFRLPYYEGQARVVGTQRWAVRSDPHDAKKWAEIPLPRHRDSSLRQPDHGIGGTVSLVPSPSAQVKLPYLPKFEAEVLSGFAGSRKTPHGGAAATLSLSSKNVPVSYSREYRDGTYKDVLQGEMGPFGAFVSKLKGDGNVKRTSGASVRKGPVNFYAEQSRTSQEDYAEYLENARNKRVGAAYESWREGPFGKGVAKLDVAREYRGSLAPVTNVRGGWEGQTGPGRLDLSGGADFIQGKVTSPYAKGSYAMEDLLGLGGRFNVNVGYGGPSDLQAGVRYTLPLHRLR